MHRHDELVDAVIEEPFDRFIEKCLGILDPPCLDVHPAVGVGRVATAEASHLQQGGRPQLRESGALHAHRVRERDAVGEVEPADVVVDGDADPVLLSGVEGEEVAGIRAEQGVEEAHRRRRAQGSGAGERLPDAELAPVGGRRVGAVLRLAPAGEGLRVGPEFGDQILAGREHDPAREREEERFGHPGAEALDEAPRLGHVDQRMAEVVVVGEGGTAQAPLEIGEPESRFEAAPQHGHRGAFVLPLDCGDERLFLVVPGGVREGMARLAQHVVGDVRDAFQHAGEARLVVAFVLVVEREPVREPGVGMGPAELHALPGPVDGVAQRIEGIGAEPVQARDFARHAIVGVVLPGLAQAGEDPGAALGEGRVREVDPHLAAADLDRVGAQPFAAVEVPAALQVELPVMPVASEDAPVVELALAQGVALVGATVVAGEHAARRVEQRDLASRLAKHQPALVLEGVEGRRPDPGAPGHWRAFRFGR